MQITSSHLFAYSLTLSSLSLCVCVCAGVFVCASVSELSYSADSLVQLKEHIRLVHCSLSGLIIWTLLHLLGASEPLLLPLNELQRASQTDRNTERAALFDWRSCQGEPQVFSQACPVFHKAALLS